jgi:molybdopterin molybdotransferase
VSHGPAMREPNAVMIPIEEALRRLDEVASPLRLETETLPVRASLGRVLRAPARARLALPPFDKSAVDGYALPDDGNEESGYRLLETVHAGETGRLPLRAGTTVKVMTGTPVPAATVRVVMVEHTEEQNDRVRILSASSGTNVCRRGENLMPGDLVVEAGRTLSPLDLGNLIAAGITEVEVSRPLRIAVLSTGNEIADDPAALGPGRIMDSNGPMLAALATTHGMDVVLSRRIPDEPGATREAIAEALAAADVVVLSGGVSEGDSDFVTPALLAMGLNALFTRVAVKPGKPVTLAADGRRVVLALPGNPVSAWLMFHIFGLRIAAHLFGAPVEPRTFRLTLATPFTRRHGERQEYVPARLDESARCSPVPYHGSAHLGALTGTDGFFVVPLGVTMMPAGAEVRFLPLGDTAMRVRAEVRSLPLGASLSASPERKP